MTRARTSQVNFRVETELLSLIYRVARKEKRNKSAIFREALVEWLEGRAYLNALPQDEIRKFIDAIHVYSKGMR